MKKILWFIFIVALIIQCAGITRAVDVYLSLTAHTERSEIGFAGIAPTNANIEESKLSRQIEEVLQYDLLFSRYFNLSEGGPAYTGTNDEMNEWKLRRVSVLICGKIKIQGSNIWLSGQLVDVDSNQIIWEKSYVGEINDYRLLAHQLNDDIILRFTGEQGIAHTKIIFSNRRSKNKELFIIDYDGFYLRQITRNNSINILPRWSPSGDEIIYTTYRYQNPDLYAISIPGYRNRAVSNVQGLNVAGSFSPDGEKIALTISKGDSPNIYLLEKTGSIIRKLTFGSSINTSPCFAPNGKEIVFISDRPGYPQLYIMNLDGGNVRRIMTKGYCDSPAWSPRGDKIAFSMRLGSGRYEIYIYDLASTKIYRLTQDERNNENPSWSPDGRFIVYSSNRSGRNEIYIMAADGSGVRKLGEIAGDSSTPSWSP